MGVLLLIVFAMVVAGAAGVLLGYGHGINRSREGRNARVQRDAVALCRDLLTNPDALDLRDRARKIVADHEAADAANRKAN